MLRPTTTISAGKTARLGFVLFAGVLSLLAAGKVILADTLDPDCFWHIQVGHRLIEGGWPRPMVDDLSFASKKEPWTPYSWLAEEGMARLWDAGGYRAAVAFQAMLEAAFFLILSAASVEACRAAAGRAGYLNALLAVGAGVILSLAYLSYRPVTMALVLLGLTAWLIFRDRRLFQQSRAVWWIPFITILTANIHFYAFVVPVWMAAIFIGDFLENRVRPQSRRLKRGAILFALTALASCLTPMLPGTIRSVWDYALNDPLVHSRVIVEMLPFYAGTMGHLSALIVIGIAISVGWRVAMGRKVDAQVRLSPGELAWFLVSAVTLLGIGRMSPLFALVGIPMFAATMPRMSDSVLTRKIAVIGATIVLCLGIGNLATAFPPAGKSMSDWLNRNGPDCPSYPCAAADYVDQIIVPVSGRIICDFPEGGYLEWRLGGHFQMLMDGRTQVFPREFWRRLFFATPEDRKNIVADSHADAAVIPRRGGMFSKALTELNWRIRFEDDYGIVMVPPK